jgi:hypothetical protein
MSREVLQTASHIENCSGFPTNVIVQFKTELMCGIKVLKSAVSCLKMFEILLWALYY